MRTVAPEWLDTLPAEDRRAVRSRRDLRRVNRIMLQAGIMLRLVHAHAGPEPPGRILELGCGDGTFMLRLARKLAKEWPSVSVTLLDRQDVVGGDTRAGFEALGWHAEVVCSDVFAYLADNRWPPVDITLANLFLHHFEANDLSRLVRRASERTPLFIACEPRRSALALAGSRSLWALGCNGVSRHDAVVSVRAGFSGRELSALWPKDGGWKLEEHPSGLFTHVFVARR
jgi:hypothetical protein